MSRISVCMIVGNVEEYIQRCLMSFLPVCDELCLVRAIGCLQPDRTVEMARELCQLHGKPFQFAEYTNAPGHEDWTHVDNFAAARQLSFDIATNDWCFWCDSDDVLKSGAEDIRKYAATGELVCYMFRYEIFGRGMAVPRERLVRKSSCRWVHRVHECLCFSPAPVRAGQDDEVVILHLPRTEKTGSHDRNLRILRSMPAEEMITGLYFHMVEELLIAGELDEAAAVSEKLLQQPDLGRPERMELFINLAHAAKDPQQVEDFLHAAYKADPRRREPLANLTNHMLNWDHPDFAMAYVRQMLSIPPPQPGKEPWNHKRPLYGWIGEELYSQCLRACGHIAAGDAVNVEALRKAGGAKIALIHATRGRGKKAAITRKIWMDLAAEPERIEYLLLFDDDDPDGKFLRRFRHVVMPAGGGCVAAWNYGAFNTSAPVLVQVSDDWTPPQCWDALILARLGDVTQPKVLAVSDGQRKDKLLCMAICTKAYIRPEGECGDCFLFHPEFKSVYSDNWFTDEAYRRGAVIEARDLVFTHAHPAFGTAAMDATYAQQNHPKRYAEGEALYRRLKSGNDWSSVPGFFDYFSFYEVMCDRVQDGDTIAEVGVWLGRSIIYLAQRLQSIGKPNVKILAVDTFRGEPGIPEHQRVVSAHGGSIRAAFEENIKRCGVADMITVLEGESPEMARQVADGSLALCFVDASHFYEAVKADLAAWWPKVKPDGLFSGHDAAWHEVDRAVKEKFGAKAVFYGNLWVVTAEGKK